MATLSIIKNKSNIYNGYEFQPEPFETTNKFSIYIPYEKDTISSLVEKVKDPKYTQNIFRCQSQPNSSRLKNKLTNEINENRTKKEEIHHSELNNELNNRREENPKQEQKKDVLEKSNVKFYDQQEPNQMKNSFNTPLKKGKKIIIKDLATSKTVERFRQTLYFDERTKTQPKSVFKNKVVEEIVEDYDTITNNNLLLDCVYKIKGLQLLKTPKIKIERQKSAGKFSFVYNDYHLRETNPGFVRNKLGTFFTR